MKIPLPVLYDSLYRRGQAILDEHDPCKLRTESDGVVSCTQSRVNGGAHPSLCCHTCEHLGPNGCTVEALACKLYLCSLLRVRVPGVFAKLEVLAIEARDAGVPAYFRHSKLENFKGVAR